MRCLWPSSNILPVGCYMLISNVPITRHYTLVSYIYNKQYCNN